MFWELCFLLAGIIAGRMLEHFTLEMPGKDSDESLPHNGCRQALPAVKQPSKALITLKDNAKSKNVIRALTMLSIYAMLFILGAKLGGDDDVFNSMGTLGLQAVGTSCCCIAGSIICVLPLRRFFKGAHSAAHSNGGGVISGLAGSVCILGCFCVALVFSRYGAVPAFILNPKTSMCTLWAMLLFVGMGIGRDLSSLTIVRHAGMRAVMIPVMTITGAALGAFAAAALVPGISLKPALLAASGMGYYSLSTAIISNQGFVALGSLALIANVFRELFTLLATPLLVRFLGPLAPAAAAGAPGMGTCLPIIVHFSGESYGILALFNGLVMVLLVPFMVPLALLMF